MSSTWERGVAAYMTELAASVGEDEGLTEATLLNGARDWNEYSQGGCSLIYDIDIAERLCPPSEIRKRIRVDGTLGNPNAQETWLDVQARALGQAACRLLRE